MTPPDAPPTPPSGAAPSEPPAPLRPGRLDAVLGALNAVLGDYLHASGNGLATPMALYVGNRPVALERAALQAAYPRAGGRAVLWVHGLGATEGVWAFPGAPEQSYPTMLERDHGFTPLTLRFNTGLHISDNGVALSALLDTLVAQYPAPLEELVLVGYSVGGLVLRSACHVAAEAGAPWLRHVRRAIYIGVPHLGAPLERLGQGVAHVLRTVPSAYTRLVADVLDLRSSGVKDLGFANLLQRDWHGASREELLRNRRHPVPLLPGIAHHLVVGTLGRDERHLLSLLFGDGIVRVASAAGRARPGHPSPLFPQEDVTVVPGVDHLGLAHHPAVYTQLERWLGEAR